MERYNKKFKDNLYKEGFKLTKVTGSRIKNIKDLRLLVADDNSGTARDILEVGSALLERGYDINVNLNDAKIFIDQIRYFLVTLHFSGNESKFYMNIEFTDNYRVLNTTNMSKFIAPFTNSLSDISKILYNYEG